MASKHIDYEKLISLASRKATCEVIEQALVAMRDSHLGLHLVISFATQCAGVEIPEKLYSKYPENMTIVLQHQFEDFKVENGVFSVVLSFNGEKGKVVVPICAILHYHDVVHDVVLNLGTMTDAENACANFQKKKHSTPKKSSSSIDDKIVAIDKFRK